VSDIHPRAVQPSRVALLLFCSGACALVYEIAWFREFRLVFGASTAANAAVLAVFIGGLGAGGAILGRRADRVPKPILFYAQLEAMVAGASALTPLLIWIARRAYIALGGAATLGSVGGTATRLVLTAAVLGVPTFLMGGTLPAAVRGIETADDNPRRGVGLLYGFNTLGAVAGCLLANFLMIETFGAQATLFVAAFANFLISRVAWSMGRSMPVQARSSPAPAAQELGAPSAPALDAGPRVEERASRPPVAAWFVLISSAAVGFAFFLMEIVWYRTLGPLLGGTVFTFGIILAVALFGIGIGGACYSLVGPKVRPTLGAFALSCVLEGALIAVPYALGDRLAMLATLLRPLGWLHFGGLVAGWTAVTMLVVFPPSVVAGVQFPLLIAMLGKGNDRVGEQTGLAYAANTGGAIAGALAGGFGLLRRSELGDWSRGFFPASPS
jgi:hypothetical protein